MIKQSVLHLSKTNPLLIAIQQDLKFTNLSLNESFVMVQNCPFWRLMYTCLTEKKMLCIINEGLLLQHVPHMVNWMRQKVDA